MNLNNSPSESELMALLQNCDDNAAHHCLWVNRVGDVQISRIPDSMTPIGFESATPDMAMRFETFDQGNGYVGREAAEDAGWVKTVFSVLVREWPTALRSSDVHYVDYF